MLVFAINVCDLMLPPLIFAPFYFLPTLDYTLDMCATLLSSHLN